MVKSENARRRGTAPGPSMHWRHQCGGSTSKVRLPDRLLREPVAARVLVLTSRGEVLGEAAGIEGGTRLARTFAGRACCVIGVDAAGVARVLARCPNATTIASETVVTKAVERWTARRKETLAAPSLGIPGRRQEPTSALVAEVAAWLRDLLSRGPMRTDEIRQLGAKRGHSPRTIKRARATACICARRRAQLPGEWSLPARDRQAPQAPAPPSSLSSGMVLGGTRPSRTRNAGVMGGAGDSAPGPEGA
jgi:hypothetical protein